MLVITSIGSQNPDNNFKEGTALIRELNKKGDGAHVFTISESTDGLNRTSITGRENIQNSKIPGVGSGAEIEFAPESDGSNIVNEDGTKGRPSEIGLGHELLHGRSANRGLRSRRDVELNVIDPDDGSFGLSKEEVDIRKKENVIRLEQGITKRAEPIDIPAIEITPEKEDKK